MKLFTIGCSFTEGQGLKHHAIQSYPYLLAKKLKIEYYNFGSCGQSNDYIFRKVFELIHSDTIDKDDIILIQWTHYIRKELPTTYNSKQWYYIAPYGVPLSDKIIHNVQSENTVLGKYYPENLDIDFKKMQTKNQKLINSYTLNFLDEDYQLNTTKNYIESLYGYLEHFGYKHLHFFGWDECVIKSVINKSNFLKETFGGYTQTPLKEHPTKEGHNKWMQYLYRTINEFKFLNEFERQLYDYRGSLDILKEEIEEEIPKLFKKRLDIINTKLKKEIEVTNTAIINEKKIELESKIQSETAELEKLKEQVQIQIEIEKEKLKHAIIKPKTLI